MSLGIILGVVVMGAAAVVVEWYSTEERKVRRTLLKSPMLNIGEFPDGAIGKVEGRLRILDDQLIAPITGRACAYYRVRVEEYRSGGSGGYWNEIVSDARGVEFAIDDETDHAIVMMQSALTAIHADYEFSSETLEDLDADQRRFVEAQGYLSASEDVRQSFRFSEAILAPGQTVTVLGYGSREPDPSAEPAGYRDAPTRLRISGSHLHPLMISNVRAPNCG